MLRQTIQKYAPQATVDQVTLMLGVSGAIYNSTIEALKDKLGVTQPRLNTLLKKLHHMAVANLNRIWDQRWAMINHLPGSPAYWSSPEHLEMCHQARTTEEDMATVTTSRHHNYLPNGVRDDPWNL